MNALKQALEKNENATVDVVMADKFSGNLKNVNLVILHQLPTLGNIGEKLIAETVKQNIPILLITGTLTNYAELTQTKLQFNIKQTRDNTNDASPKLNTEFNLFTLSDEIKQRINKFPPIQSPYGTYKNFTGQLILLKQKIGSVETEQPLFAFSENGNERNGIICGEGIWRWRMTDYAINGNSNAFDELIQKTAQLLSSKIDKSKFKIYCEKKYLENDEINFSAELYNDNYEAINEPELSMTITDDKGKAYPYVFSKNNNGYKLNAGNFSPGLYSYNSKTKLGNKEYVVKGTFLVEAVQLEATNTTANHQLLKNLSVATNGAFFQKNNTEKLI